MDAFSSLSGDNSICEVPAEILLDQRDHMKVDCIMEKVFGFSELEGVISFESLLKEVPLTECFSCVLDIVIHVCHPYLEELSFLLHNFSLQLFDD